MAEKIVSNVHDIQDNDLLPLREVLGAAGSVQLITALAFFDVECRLELVSGVYWMATNPRVNSAIEGETPNFTNVMLHRRDMFECFGDLYSSIMDIVN